MKRKSVIWLWLSGGPTHVETFDPKMDAPVEYRSVTGEVKTPIPGVTIGGSGPFDTPVMDLDGNVLFRARLLNTTGGTLTERGMFFGRANGDVHMFLQAGDQEPSLTLPGVTLNTLSSSTGLPSFALPVCRWARWSSTRSAVPNSMTSSCDWPPNARFQKAF